MSIEELKDLIRKKTGVSVKDAHMLSLYLNEIWRWNQRINLVGVSSIDRMTDELLLDSLMAGELLPERGTLLDMGSGAGFPGIPLKVIKKNMQVHLVEAKVKKAVFLRYIIKRLSLKDIHVIEGRIEDLKNKLFSNYDVVIFRGIRLVSGLTLAYPYIQNGVIISFQGGAYNRAVDEARDFMEKNRLEMVGVKEYMISKRKRALLLFKKL